MIEAVAYSNAMDRKALGAAEPLGFGATFSDHMLLAEFAADLGWHSQLIQPYGPLFLDPATMALHYGQAVFEGIKAFRGDDGSVRLFRPQKYIERLMASAKRMCIPPLEPDQLLKWLLDLVRLDEAWVPRTRGSSLYIRPTIIASDAALGVRPSRSYLLFAIASPVDSYYGEAMAPVRIRVEEDYVRAVDGGVGVAKTGGNYAASLAAAEAAHEAGFTQVLWLDGKERRYLEEIGTMNVMLRIGDEVITPNLSGSILAGVIRDSALTLMRDWGLQVSEQPVAIDEVIGAAKKGTLREVWGSGTAAGIAPVSELSYRDESFIINEGRPGEVSVLLYAALSDIQYARVADTRGWTVEA
ncbi:MAG TPA: branched-chain amino acid aminotransferase [Dehalococcoidia bacterium]|nr:branched-chain amino acid aminotransferase [Dehalococcoidia bacterium]